LTDGAWADWQMSFTGDLDKKEDDKEKADKQEGDEATSVNGSVIYPFVAYGNETLPAQETVLITNANVWTNEADGVLENNDVMIQNSKIS